MLTIYVGMALTEAPEEFRGSFQKELKDALASLPNIQILDFVGLENGDEGQVYTHDRRCTEQADLCVFICDYPSIGLGIEIAFRFLTGKPMLCFARDGQRVTRMLLGMCQFEEIPFHRYDFVDEIVSLVKERLEYA
ncbi:MAG: hypothetical protein WDZ93_03055 [Candidatus Paceibacterota bacterium]